MAFFKNGLIMKSGGEAAKNGFDTARTEIRNPFPGLPFNSEKFAFDSDAAFGDGLGELMEEGIKLLFRFDQARFLFSCKRGHVI